LSRSYRKHPIVKDIIRGAKKAANRKVRKIDDEISDGNKYRRFYPQWDVIDHSFRTTLEEEIMYWHRRQADDYPKITWGRRKEKTLEETIIDWKKLYYWK
jgi:hypothetical protein